MYWSQLNTVYNLAIISLTILLANDYQRSTVDAFLNHHQFRCYRTRSVAVVEQVVLKPTTLVLLQSNINNVNNPTTTPPISNTYNTYNKNHNLKKEFQKNGIIYKKSIFTKDEFQTIKNQINQIPTHLYQNEKSNTIARERIGLTLDKDCDIVRLLGSEGDGSLYQLINEIMGHDYNYDNNDDIIDDAASDSVVDSNRVKPKMVLSNLVPVELRVYEKIGAGMEWHYDDVLYNPEQIEIIFTIENNSDCVTKWDLGSKNSNNNSNINSNNLIEVETEANSAIILRAGSKYGVPHFVSSLKSGRRSILKFVYVQNDAIFLEDAESHVNQFSKTSSSSLQKKKKKKGKNNKRRK